MLSFVTWLVLAPVAGLTAVVDVSIPYAITTVGIVATMLLLVPAALTAVNLVQTMQGRWTLVFGAGAAAFAIVALAFLFAASLLDAIGALRVVDQLVGGTGWERGAFLWAAYGTFTFAAFALAEHALPRMLRRAWGGGIALRRPAVADVRRRDRRRPGADGRRAGRGVAPGGREPRRMPSTRRLMIYRVNRVPGLRPGRPGWPGVPGEPVPDVHQWRADRVRRAGAAGCRGGGTLSR